jgi:hypothetical protein
VSDELPPFDPSLAAWAPRGEDDADDVIRALKMAKLNMAYASDAVVALVAHWGMESLPAFQRGWLLLVLGKPGSNERALTHGVRLSFAVPDGDVRVDIEDVDPDTTWAGRLASAWYSGDMDTVHALEAAPSDSIRQEINRAIELLRGISYLVANDVPQDAR